MCVCSVLLLCFERLFILALTKFCITESAHLLLWVWMDKQAVNNQNVTPSIFSVKPFPLHRMSFWMDLSVRTHYTVVCEYFGINKCQYRMPSHIIIWWRTGVFAVAAPFRSHTTPVRISRRSSSVFVSLSCYWHSSTSAECNTRTRTHTHTQAHTFWSGASVFV